MKIFCFEFWFKEIYSRIIDAGQQLEKKNFKPHFIWLLARIRIYRYNLYTLMNAHKLFQTPFKFPLIWPVRYSLPILCEKRVFGLILIPNTGTNPPLEQFF